MDALLKVQSGAAPTTRPLSPAGAPSPRGTSEYRPVAADPRMPDRSTASAADLREAASRLSARMEQEGNRITFSVDEELGRVVVKVIDPETREVVRQIPPQEFLDLAHQLIDMDGRQGLLADKIA